MTDTTTKTEVRSLNLKFVPIDSIAAGGNGGHARKTRTNGADSDAKLEAHIRARGLLLPLLVREVSRDHFEVVDGNRRLAVLRKLNPKADIPVVVRNPGSPMEDSLATFFLREGLHPVDEFEAFAYLVGEDGLSADDIARRFGLKRKAVDQVLALGNIAPMLRDLWRSGKIGREEAEAFTLSPDHARQVEVYKKLDKLRGGHITRYEVRHELAGDTRKIEAMLNLVGAKPYEAAGGIVTQDLFGDSRAVSDLALLEKLAAAALQAECVRLMQTEGWWLALSREHETYEKRHGMTRIHPAAPKYEAEEKAQIEKLKNSTAVGAYTKAALIEQRGLMRGYSDKQKAKCAVFVGFLENGGFAYEPGYVDSPQTSDLTPAARLKKAKPATADKADISGALAKRLATQRALALKAALRDDATRRRDPLLQELAIITAALIDPYFPQNTPPALLARFDSIEAEVEANIMGKALAKAFDSKDYFESAAKPLVLKAIGELQGAAAVKLLAGKSKADVARAAIKVATAQAWLPPQLRLKGGKRGKPRK